MTLATSFAELQEQLEILRELLMNLQITIAEDKPLRGVSELVRQLDEATVDLRGYLEEALTAVTDGWRAVDGDYDLDRARRSLVICQRQLDLFLEVYSSRLIAYERITALDRLGRKRGGEWMAWAELVGDTIDRCQGHVIEVNRKFFNCWQEIAERASATPVSVRATNIGQQIAVSEISN